VSPMSRSTRLCAALGFIALLPGCSSSNARYVSPYSTKWVKQQIRAYEMRGPSQVTGKGIHADKPVYLIPSPCCDKYDYFYDSRGVILCAPSGGFTGRGDGSCPEILGTARR
jgi:hypothetical protein